MENLANHHYQLMDQILKPLWLASASGNHPPFIHLMKQDLTHCIVYIEKLVSFDIFSTDTFCCWQEAGSKILQYLCSCFQNLY